ncbi:MAG: 30S ribosomal protein S6, partial [Mesorhizobium sp.]|nr:30S ribosomal protein S6 [Mesorhizobium sp.]
DRERGPRQFGDRDRGDRPARNFGDRDGGGDRGPRRPREGFEGSAE